MLSETRRETMKTQIKIYEMEAKTRNGHAAEMNVDGIIRGGFSANGSFYYCGSMSHGCFECVTNETLTLL